MSTTLGLLGGGELASRFAVNNERLQLKLMGGAYIGFGVSSAFIYLAPDEYWAFAFVAIGIAGACLATAPLFALIQAVVPERMRATALAALFLFSNLIGMGLGPLLIGALSDALRPAFGDDSLRYALLAGCPAYAWAAIHMWFARKHVFDDLRRAQEDAEIAPHDEPDTQNNALESLHRQSDSPPAKES